MKVLYFHQHFSTPKGSTGTRSYEMAKHLIKRGHNVTIVCGSSSVSNTGLTGTSKHGIRRGVVAGIDVIEIILPYSNSDRLLKRASAFLRYAFTSIYIACREKYDLIFASSTPLTAALPGIVMRVIKPRSPFVFEVRDLWPELPRAMGMTNPFVLGGMSILEKMSYWAMRGGIALSPGIRDGMKRRSPQITPIELIPNGCDLVLFQPQICSSNIPNPSMELPEARLRCIFTGAHGTANGLDAVLDTARVLIERGRSDIHFLFIGDGQLKPKLINRKLDENLFNCTFNNLVPKDQLNSIMGQVNVGLMTLANIPAFYYGTSPNKFFDYIASGLPVLNNYPGWLADLISETNCGVAIPPERADLFADALETLADNPDIRRTMGENGRRLAESRFNRMELADCFVSFLEQCASGFTSYNPPEEKE